MREIQKSEICLRVRLHSCLEPYLIPCVILTARLFTKSLTVGYMKKDHEIQAY